MMVGPSSPREHLAVLASFGPRIANAAWAGVIAFGVGVIGTILLVVSTSRLYRSEATMTYERGASTLATDGDVLRTLATRLHDMLSSRQRLEGTIRDMKLYRGIVDRHGMGEAIDEMRKHVNVSGRDGATYRVSYEGESRDLAKDVLDRLVRGIVDDDRKRRVKEVEETKRFLDTERQNADEDLKGKETDLAAFLAKHPQLAGEAGGGAASAGGLLRAADRDRAANLTGGDTSGLELQAAQIEESLAAAGARPAASKEVPLDPALMAARTRAQAEVQAAQKDLLDKQTHLTNEHPDVKQALRRLTVAEQAERRAEAAAEGWKPPAPAAGGEAPTEESGRVEALRHALAAVRQQISSTRSRSGPRVEVPKTVSSVVEIDTQWTRLNREVSEARERQSQLEGKQFQAQLAATLLDGGLGGQLVVADPPFRPTRPIAGGRFKIVLVGLAGSMLLAFLVIGMFAALDDRLYGLRDVDSVLDDGIVVVIPSAPRRLPAKGDTAGKEAKAKAKAKATGSETAGADKAGSSGG